MIKKKRNSTMNFVRKVMDYLIGKRKVIIEPIEFYEKDGWFIAKIPQHDPNEEECEKNENRRNVF